MEKPQSHCLTSKSAANNACALARFALLICLCLAAGLGAAQASPRDYSISPPRVNYTADGEFAVVAFSVSNQGGDASEPSQILISEYQSGRIETSEQLPALAADQTQDFSIQLPLAKLSADGIISFKIEAGIDEFELAESPIARDNSQLFHIDRSQAGDAGGNNRATDSTTAAEAAYDLYIPIVNMGVNFFGDGIQLNERRYSSAEILRALGLLALALFCLWLLSLILRLIFRRPPRFDVWQPPYATNNWHDPNSAEGRRQSWQFHAQNSALDSPSAPDQVTVLKRLLDKRGLILGGWKIKAMRTVQYDVYGRINRTEVVMPSKLVKRLNHVLRRAPGYANDELRKAMEPIAKSLCRQALGPVEEQNLMLPLALDIRFEGVAEKIRIQFELYQHHDRAWRLIDQWEPALGPVGEHVPEHFSFTLNGQLSGESDKAFKARLRDDVTQLLARLLYHHQAEESAARANEPQSLPDLLNTEEAPWGDAPLDDETDPRSIPAS